MPEKPEVMNVVDNLKKRLLGKNIVDCKVYWNNIIKTPIVEDFISKIKNQKIINIDSKGKFIVIELSNNFLLVHLRMEGKFVFRNINDIKDKHEHVEFILDDGVSFRFMDVRKFGKMHLLSKNNYLDIEPLSKLGFDYYDDNLNSNYLFKKLKKKRLPIKTLLLDQSIIAGIGNIYADEILFLSCINPLKKGVDITGDDCFKIIKNTKEVLDKAYKLGGTTIRSFTSSEGVYGNFQNNLYVHSRENEECFTCKSQIIKIKVNGRGTYYCPICQNAV